MNELKRLHGEKEGYKVKEDYDTRLKEAGFFLKMIKGQLLQRLQSRMQIRRE